MYGCRFANLQDDAPLIVNPPTWSSCQIDALQGDDVDPALQSRLSLERIYLYSAACACACEHQQIRDQIMRRAAAKATVDEAGAGAVRGRGRGRARGRGGRGRGRTGLDVCQRHIWYRFHAEACKDLAGWPEEKASSTTPTS